MHALGLLALVFSISSGAFAQLSKPIKGFIEIERDRALFVDYIPPQAGQPTFVLLNGLTYSVDSWDSFTRAMALKGMGILRYDPIGMGKTLEAMGPVEDVIRIEDQARDLDLLTKRIGLRGKVNLIGLSYGGGLAIVFAGAYPKRIGQVFLMAPYTEPLTAQDSWIKTQILQVRMNFPMNPATDDELYAYFLRQSVYTVYPLSEPSVLSSPLKPEAVFQMTQGIRKFDIKRASQAFPAGSVHLMIGSFDQYVPRSALYQFWDQLPVASQASMMIVMGSEHKIPEAAPDFAAHWIAAKTLNQYNSNKTWDGYPATGRIVPRPYKKAE